MCVVYCRRCGAARSTYEDVITNQRARRCAACHLRVVDGEVLGREDRCTLLTARELAVSANPIHGTASCVDSIAQFFDDIAGWRSERAVLVLGGENGRQTTDWAGGAEVGL